MYLKLLKEMRFGLSLQCCTHARVSSCGGHRPRIYELRTMGVALLTAAEKLWVTYTM